MNENIENSKNQKMQINKNNENYSQPSCFRFYIKLKDEDIIEIISLENNNDYKSDGNLISKDTIEHCIEKKMNSSI